MNDQRRKDIRAALAKIGEARGELETAMNDEQEYFDAMPESLQSGEKGEKATECIDTLQSAIDSLENLDSEIEGVIG